MVEVDTLFKKSFALWVSSADLSGYASVSVTQFQACRCEKRDLNLYAR